MEICRYLIEKGAKIDQVRSKCVEAALERVDAQGRANCVKCYDKNLHLSGLFLLSVLPLWRIPSQTSSIPPSHITATIA